MHTTLNEIRRHSPCGDSWAKLLEGLGKTSPDDEQLSLWTIYTICGFDDALWALRAMPESMDNSIRLLVCDMVEPSLKFTDDDRIHDAIRAARKLAHGEATKDQLFAARVATYGASRPSPEAPAREAPAREASVKDAAWAAAWAAAGEAAKAAAWEAAKDAAWTAAGEAARAAAWAAAGEAARAAAWDVARDVARDAQEGVFKAWFDKMEAEGCAG